jgi:phosphinothricin acetyltransferase
MSAEAGASRVRGGPLSLEVRAAREEDLPAINDLYNHYIVNTAITFDIEPWSLEQRREWFGHYKETGRHRVLVAVEDGQVAGYASSSRFRPKAAYETSVESSVYLTPGLTGRGIGAALYRRLFEVLEGEAVHRVLAGITLPNPASLGLHQRFGFRPVGVFDEVGCKHERYWSVQWMEKLF